MAWDVDKLHVETRCQKCDGKIMTMPLKTFSGLFVDTPFEGTLFIPDSLLCVKCGSYMDITIRDNVKKETEKKS